LFLARGPGQSDIPAILTRDELYLFFNAMLAEPLGILTSSEREVLLQTSAMHAAAHGAAPPFQLRPGLVAEMMRFYDQLRRQGQSVDRYESLLVESLDADSDRGAERLLRQTRFLAASYRAYEQRVAALPAVDEHALRAHLIQHAAARPLKRIVVAVGDWIADPHGLFAADFDLLTRVSGLAEIDIIATSGLLGSGFDQRLNDWLPGLDTIEGSDLGVAASPVPRMLVPNREDGVPVWIHRDREEELVAVARRAAIEPDVHAVVFAKPLPYLYLAREVFGSARIPHQAAPVAPARVGSGPDAPGPRRTRSCDARAAVSWRDRRPACICRGLHQWRCRGPSGRGGCRSRRGGAAVADTLRSGVGTAHGAGDVS
jgi:hypothetical protein